MAPQRKRICVLVDYYLPGYKGGGPIRSISNLIEGLSSHYDFSIVTRDRDLGPGETAYPGIKADSWIQADKTRVYYASPSGLSPKALAEVLRSEPYDLLYINSFFSPKLSIAPIWLGLWGRLEGKPVIVAPRGEFSPGALSLKAAKKHAYLALAKGLGIYKPAIWQSTSIQESEDIRRQFGRGARIHLAHNLPASFEWRDPDSRGLEPKRPGYLKIVFLARVARKKNLLQAIQSLRRLSGKVDLSIYGPIEDEEYWRECQAAAKSLPEGIQVSYHGPVLADDVMPTVARHHLYFLPTLGENFGHSIAEALLAGCPILVSDKTPWVDLEAHRAGWDLPLADENGFVRALEISLAWNQAEWGLWCRGARDLVLTRLNASQALRETRDLFEAAVLPKR